MYSTPADWPSPLTLVLADSELDSAERRGDEAVLTLASARVHWPSLTQRAPQQGWVWPLRLQFTGIQDWEAAALVPGRIASAHLQCDGQDLTLTLPGRLKGRLTLTLEGSRGGRLRLQAAALLVALDGAQLRESLAC
ncbi:hypothetical protein QRD43_01665 [Pelomonas sp. APW6]|uniref:Uncharacterized protein n=1 Tax=Roseateles subflavus TaxID=3053353 RepID=A0ABT7LG20_9BURK|nr:hypothetical protein [Pelomonas sp. APW6]MDL5030600.1 hypothetical protein [Pelomonas sp. APW6]